MPAASSWLKYYFVAALLTPCSCHCSVERVRRVRVMFDLLEENSMMYDSVHSSVEVTTLRGGLKTTFPLQPPPVAFSCDLLANYTFTWEEGIDNISLLFIARQRGRCCDSRGTERTRDMSPSSSPEHNHPNVHAHVHALTYTQMYIPTLNDINFVNKNMAAYVHVYSHFVWHYPLRFII